MSILFLSTPSARRATTAAPQVNQQMPISIHALREEGDGDAMDRVDAKVISIHALREEGDPLSEEDYNSCRKFLSTPSARRATAKAGLWGIRQQISIHALREEGDAVRKGHHMEKENFYPRPPRGGRPLYHKSSLTMRDFYPRPPRGGRLCVHAVQQVFQLISIHALREEGDPVDQQRPAGRKNFYPRPPRGGRRARCFRGSVRLSFLSTPSARRATTRPNN